VKLELIATRFHCSLWFVAKWSRKSRRLCISSTEEELNEQENDAEPLIKSAIRLPCLEELYLRWW
jgi:hypothetical protein